MNANSASMRALITLFEAFLVLLASNASTQDKLKPITLQTTVQEFALECQHPAKKSRPTERLSICTTYIAGAVHQVALAKKSPKCWQEIEEGGAAPAVVGEILFHLATLPEERKKPVGEALRFVLLEVAIKNCR